MNESRFDDFEQQDTVVQRARTRSSQRSRRRKRSVKPWMPVALAVALVVVIAAVLLIGMKGCGAEPSIEGRWNLDGATVYEFYGEGKGALVLTTMTFEFNYTIEKDVVSIDFIDERATDAKYEYAIENDLLMLTGGPGDAKSQHILKREA